MKRILLVLFFLIYATAFSQEITGIVLDQKTNQPIETVAVYFDNTTNGVITNSKGFFRIEYKKGIKTPLVVSYLGYKKIIFENYESNKYYKFLLEEEEGVLDEVVLISKDEWTREQKLRHFRKEFLGFTENGQSCTIVNEDDIQLQFSKKHKKLIANAKKPIIVINKNLNYRLFYDMQGFEIRFDAHHFKNKDSTLRRINYVIKSVYYAGTSLFSELDEINNKIRKKRNNTYYGSVLHFMRAMANNQLDNDGFKIISGGYKVEPEKFIYINTLETENLVEVEIKKRIGIVYKRKQSFVVPDGTMFTIDVYGNYSPIESLSFGGEMGKSRIGDTLPLDFLILD